MKSVTYGQVVNFYKDQELTTERLEKFLSSYRQKIGGYISLWNTFCSSGSNGGEDDRKFYSLLRNKEMEHSLLNMQSFNGMKEEEVVDLLQTDGKINQKWHVFVSYMAYQELNHVVEKFDEEHFPKGNNIPCKEFWLWLIETAAIKNGYKIIEKKEIDTLYDSACNQNDPETWKKLKKELWEKTKIIILSSI